MRVVLVGVILVFNMEGKSTHGFSTIEMLVAFAIFVLIFSGLIVVVYGNDSFALDSQLNNEGLFYAEEGLNELRAQVENDWGFDGFTHMADGTRYTINTTSTSITKCKNLLESTASWDTPPLRSQYVTLLSTIISLTENDKTGNDCPDEPKDRWKHPDTFASANINPPAAKGTSLDVTTVNDHRYVFLTSEHASTSVSDLWIYDVDDSQNPNLLVDLNISSGLNDIDVAKSEASGEYYAYIANASSTSGTSTDELLIFKVSDPGAPSFITSITLGITPNCPLYCPGGAKTIYYYDNRIYIGTHRIGGHEFHIIDVTNPEIPGTHWSINLEHNVNDIVVSGGYAYLATSDNTGELIILDVSSPNVLEPDDGIKIEATFDASGDKDGTSLYLLGDTIYLGRVRSGPDGDFYIINVAESDNPIEISGTDIGMDPNMAKVESLVVLDGLAFLGTSDSNQEFQVWDVSIPESPQWWSEDDFPQAVTGIDFYPDPIHGDMVYAAVRSNKALRIIFDDPAAY